MPWINLSEVFPIPYNLVFPNRIKLNKNKTPPKTHLLAIRNLKQLVNSHPYAFPYGIPLPVLFLFCSWRSEKNTSSGVCLVFKFYLWLIRYMILEKYSNLKISYLPHVLARIKNAYIARLCSNWMRNICKVLSTLTCS